MPNVRALGHRLSCLVAGLVDGSPIANMLEGAGFDVVHSVAAGDTLKALDGETWGAVFVAEWMGSPALKTIIERSNHDGSHPPVVVIGSSAEVESEGRALAMSLGAADFIAAPITQDAFDARLRRLFPASPVEPQPGNGPPADALASTACDQLTIPATAPLAEVERLVIIEHLKRCRTKADAARSLGIGLRTLYTKIGKFQLAGVARPPRTERNGRG